LRPDSASPSEKIMNMNRTIMKRNKHSRLAAALLSFLLLLSLMPTSVFATGGEGNTTPKITVGWRYDIGDSGNDYKVCEDAKRITLLSGNGDNDNVNITTLKQSDKVVFSVDVDPQYAEYTTYEWRHSLQQWNGTKPVITTVVYPNTGNTLSLTGIYAGSSHLLNKYLCTVRCTIEGVTYSCTISFRCKVTGENPLLAPAFCTQPESATYKQDESAAPLTVAVDSTSNADRKVHLVYQWYKADNESDAGTAIEGATTNTYTPATSGTGTVYYYCEVQDRYKQSGQTYVSEKVCSERAKIQVTTGGFSLPGTGTADDPKLIYTADDLKQIHEMVAEGNGFEGYYFRFENDITLPDDWTPIGCTVDGTNKFDPRKPSEKDNLRAFSGTILGNGKLLTVPKGGRPLLAYVKNATVKDLNIYGEEINGYGLVDGLHGVGFTSSDTFAIIIENVTLKSGTKTLKSGLIGAEVDNDVNGFAGASAAFITTIRNCTIEEGVVIGYDGSQSEIGAFAGRFQGIIENCVSHATVKGVDYVGGIIGSRDNAMGQCTVSKCSFDGAVIASGKFAGGITGAMYIGGGAPNGVKTTIQGCTASGTVTGTENVGGITGGDRSVNQAWNEYSVTGNTFSGKVSGTKNVGGIIGYYRSLNKFDNIAGNAYLKGCGAEQGIGAVDYVDTSCETHETASGATYFDTSKSLPDIYGVTKTNHNRVDDPLGKDVEKLAKAVDDVSTPVCYKLEISGAKTEYYVGDEFDLTGATITAYWTMGKANTHPTQVDLKITGYDSSKHGQQTVTLQYGAAKVEIVVTVLYKEPEDITVTITLLGDKAHGDNGQVHGLSKGGLTAWVSGHKVKVTTNMTVWDALKQLPGVTWDNPTGNYIKSVTYGGVTIGEFTNGKNSGWMYTLNGKYPMLGVSEQYLKKGDVIVFHYTDDYTLEAADMGPAPEEKKTADEVIALINAIGVVDLTKGDVIAKARAAYDALSAADKKLVTNYQTLLDAEAAYAKLVAELGKKADSIYKTTGDYLAKLGTPGVGSIGGEWMALGLARSGRTVPEGYYDAVVKYVKDNIDSNGRLDKNKATENARIILALTAIGKDVTNVGGHDLLAGLNEMSYLSKQGINGAIFTLIALDSHSYTPAGDVTRDKLVQVILDAQISSDGGWSLDGKNADVDMTAMAIQALAAYYKSNSSAKKAVDKGLSWLSSVQQNDGGFTSWGAANSESCAQVIVALTALGIDPAKDSRFIKNGVSVLDALCSFAVNGGGFKHLATETSANGMATEQGFYALVAYYRLLNGQTSLYDMTDVKLEGVKAEEPVDDTDKSDDTADTEVEDTSSGGQVVLWVVIGVVAVGGIAALAVTSKKRHGRDAE
jgi:hypothetical protein